MLFPLFEMIIASRADLVAGRQATRLVAANLGLDTLDATQLATAVSEIVRYTHHRGSEGRVEFGVDTGAHPELRVTVSHEQAGASVGRAAADTYENGLGVSGTIAARRLVDRFEVIAGPHGGTVIILGKRMPGRLNPVQLTEIASRIKAEVSTYEEVRRQNEELLSALEMLTERQDELSLMNIELEDTNRGVVALHSQMEDQAVSLREAQETRDRFLYFVTHEIRTPVSAIIALARLLAERVDGDLSPEQEKQVKMILDSGTALNSLVNDILDLARAREGKVSLNVRCFQVAGVISSLRGMMRPLADSRVELRFEEPPAGLEIWSDETKVAHILRNFVSNALKFTERGFVRVFVSGPNDEGEIVFSVEDTGIGIARGDRERIFAEFTQIDHPIQGKVRGTGLGLPLCRMLAELLGGRIEVESEVGKGSVFSLTLPLDSRQPGRLSE